MKSAQPPQVIVVNENGNNLNNNFSINRPLANSIAGIVDGSGILTQINPSPIVQQQTSNHQAISTNISTPPEHLHKSPALTSTGSASTISCGSCLQPICDRYIMKVVETPYHERCLQCVSCCCSLSNTCYQKDNKLYCRIDYERWVLKIIKRTILFEENDFKAKSWKLHFSSLIFSTNLNLNENLPPISLLKIIS